LLLPTDPELQERAGAIMPVGTAQLSAVRSTNDRSGNPSSIIASVGPMDGVETAGAVKPLRP